MRAPMIVAVGIVAAIYVAICALLFFNQRSQIYFPTAAVTRADLGTLVVESGGEQLKLWRVGTRTGDPVAPALLYFGGNAESVDGNATDFARAFPNHAVYLVNYRGYDGSTGEPSEAALYADAEAIHDVIRVRHPVSGISVIGRSLGSGVATHLAATREVHRLVLVTPFDSLVDVAREHFRWLPVGLLLRERFESMERVRAGRVRAPTLIVIATQDEVVPAARGEALASAFPPGQVQVVRLAGAQHNSVGGFPEYLQALSKFISG
jgi:pimeloyl-ACP methyl ester carboxylesterase